MKRLFPLVLMCTVACRCSAQKTVEYCANIGPVLFTFEQDSVVGSYLITVTPTPVKGKIKGTMKGGLLDAIWIDTEGTGRMLAGFSNDKNHFSGFYNTSS